MKQLRCIGLRKVEAARLGWLELPGWDEGPTEYGKGQTYGTWKAQRFCLLAVVAWQNLQQAYRKRPTMNQSCAFFEMRSVCIISHTQTDWSSDTASKPLRFRSLAEYLPLVRLLFIESTHEVTDESWRPQKRHMKAGCCFHFELSWIFKSWAPCGGYGCSPISMLGRLWLPLNFKRFSFFFPGNAMAFLRRCNIMQYLGHRSTSAPGICCERNKEACQSRVCWIVLDKNLKEMQSQSAQAIRHSSNTLKQ